MRGPLPLPKAEMLKLPEALTELNMSRAAFYRMRARGPALESSSCRTDSSVSAVPTSTPGWSTTKKLPPPDPRSVGPALVAGPTSLSGEQLSADL